MTSVKLLRDEGGWRSMNADNEYKFSVVEFLQKPPPGIGKYVCVPDSWIKTRRETDQKVGVKYPKAKKNDIEKLIEEHEADGPLESWPEFLCEIKYNTQCRDDAKIYIMTKELDDSKKKRIAPKRPVRKYRSRKPNMAPRKKTTRARVEISESSGQDDNSQDESNVQTKSSMKPQEFLKEAGQLLSETAKTLSKLSDLVISYASTGEKPAVPAKVANATSTPDIHEEETTDEVQLPNIRHLIRPSLVVPADFDNDTKWTLRHRQPARHLFELMADSGVYVSKREIQRCIIASRNTAQLVKHLLISVFNENALAVCAVTGYETASYENNEVRPGLDKAGKDAMLSFITVYTRCLNWPTMSRRAFNKCLRTRLIEFRRRAMVLDSM